MDSADEKLAVSVRLPVEALRGILNDEVSTLRDERAALAAERESYETLYEKVAKTHLEEAIKLDVGGTTFKTTLSTLTKVRPPVLSVAAVSCEVVFSRCPEVCSRCCSVAVVCLCKRARTARTS